MKLAIVLGTPVMLAGALSALSLSGCSLLAARSPATVGIACADQKVATQPASNTYPVSIELFGANRRPTGGSIITITAANGKPVATAACMSAKTVLRLPPGHYQAVIDMEDGPTRTLAFDVKSDSQPLTLAEYFPTITARV